MKQDKIDYEKVKAGDIIGKITDEEEKILARARNKIRSTENTIKMLNDEIAKERLIIKEVWNRYDISLEDETKLIGRGLCRSIYKNNIQLHDVEKEEYFEALLHTLIH